MYNQSHNRNFRGSSGSRGGFNRGQRPIKTFNPSHMVGAIPEHVEEAPYVAQHTFADFQLAPTLLANVLAKGYTVPTPIQDQTIPQILDGKDLIGIANTGTGKTAAFLIPLIQKIYSNKFQKVLIVSPTRELASQINDEFRSFVRGLGVYSVLAIGGTSMQRQRNDLNRPFNFLIGTPGRIKDLVNTRMLRMEDYKIVVLDEADHMVDIGFIHDIQFIVSKLPQPRQSLFFSATIGGKVREIIQQFVTDPITVSVKTQEMAANVEQQTVKVDRYKKIEHLQNLLGQKEFEKVLIFGRTKHGVQRLSDELVKRGFKADAIHGNKAQGQRLRTLDRFKRNEITILLATDVAARGLDIPNVSHVINYDLPDTQDAYTHRIGRTGRADKKGIALTFVE